MIDRAQEKYDQQKESWSIYLSFINTYIEWWNKIIIAAFKKLGKDEGVDILEIINDPKKYSESSADIKEKIKVCHANLFKDVPSEIKTKARNRLIDVESEVLCSLIKNSPRIDMCAKINLKWPRFQPFCYSCSQGWN